MYQNYYNCWFLKHAEAPTVPYDKFCLNATARGATTHDYDRFAFKWSLLSSSYLWFSTLAILVFPIGDIYGRKALLLVGGLSGLLGNILKLLAFYKDSYILMVTGQIITSVKSGLGLMATPLYLVEIAPDGLEDAYGVWFSFGFAFGHVLGVGFGLEQIFGTYDKWQYSIAVGIAFNVCQLLPHPFAMESPSWLKEKSHTRTAVYQIVNSTKLNFTYPSTQLELVAVSRTHSTSKKCILT